MQPWEMGYGQGSWPPGYARSSTAPIGPRPSSNSLRPVSPPSQRSYAASPASDYRFPAPSVSGAQSTYRALPSSAAAVSSSSGLERRSSASLRPQPNLPSSYGQTSVTPSQITSFASAVQYLQPKRPHPRSSSPDPRSSSPMSRSSSGSASSARSSSFSGQSTPPSPSSISSSRYPTSPSPSMSASSALLREEPCSGCGKLIKLRPQEHAGLCHACGTLLLDNRAFAQSKTKNSTGFVSMASIQPPSPPPRSGSLSSTFPRSYTPSPSSFSSSSTTTFRKTTVPTTSPPLSALMQVAYEMDRAGLYPPAPPTSPLRQSSSGNPFAEGTGGYMNFPGVTPSRIETSSPVPSSLSRRGSFSSGSLMLSRPQSRSSLSRPSSPQPSPGRPLPSSLSRGGYQGGGYPGSSSRPYS